ncbi:GTP-binding protein [Salix suchowensis]|nr:GTP-binding protein [Salix suchowensis]
MSCTDAVQTSEPFWLENRLVRLIDTPGFDDTAKTDTEVLTMTAAFLSSMYRRGVMLSGVIYIHRISDIRMGGTSTRNFKLFRGLCGETMLRNAVIVTNMWGEVALDVGEAREEELTSQDDFFKPVLERGAQLKRHDNTPASADVIVGCVASKKPRALRIQRELVDDRKVITETTAGAELGRELHEQAMKFKEKRRRLQDEMDEEQLASSYADDKARLKKRQQDLKTAAQQESERQAAEHKRRMADIDDRLRCTRESGSTETMQLAARLRRLQRQQAEPARRQPRRGLWDDFLDFLSAGQRYSE